MKLPLCGMALITAMWVAACTPTVKMQAPEKPIEINMNVKIEHEIRVRVEKDIAQMLEENQDLF